MSEFTTAKLNAEGVYDVEVQEVLERASGLRLIDVRRPEEYTGELGHIRGAELMTLETQFAIGIRGENPDQVIVFICRSGVRSSRAAAYAQALGFKKVFNMEGGMIEWNERGLPTTLD